MLKGGGTMDLRPRSSFHLFLLTIILIVALTGCGGGDSATAAIESPSPADDQDTPESSGGGDVAQEPPFDTSMIPEAELPEDFPESFPIPEDATISFDASLPSEEDFRVFISLLSSLEEAQAYYQRELPARGWTILEEATTSRGTEMTLTSPAHDGELLFIAADLGVALDVHLFPPGGDQAMPDLTEDLEEPTSPDESGGALPSDLSLPSVFTPIELTDSLEAEGYEFAFTYMGTAELAMVDLNIALMTIGWDLGELTLGGASGEYIVPFEDPANGFAGYATITSNPGQFNVDAPGAALIALAPGQP
jgi:hypothetical protein